MADNETYEILALKYARHAERTRRDNFLLADDHASPQPIDYYIWVIRNERRTILVDTGFDRAEAKTRDRVLDRERREALELIGVAAETMETVVISHLHYDHAGTLEQFPAARFHVQEEEMAYATGRCMCDEILRRPFTAEHVCQLVKNVYSGRVTFYDGDGAIAPGVTVHKVAGHSKGLQCVRVLTQPAGSCSRPTPRTFTRTSSSASRSQSSSTSRQRSEATTGSSSSRPRVATSFPATIRWSCSATRP